MLAHADYKWSLRGLEGSAREEAKHACHARGADRLQRLCFANGGIYIKLGQHVAQLVRARPTCMQAQKCSRNGSCSHALQACSATLLYCRVIGKVVVQSHLTCWVGNSTALEWPLMTGSCHSSCPLGAEQAAFTPYSPAVQDHMLPSEYVTAMRKSMLDKCPVGSYAQVARTISEDLGSTPDTLFASFEPAPVASASLAQVGLRCMPGILTNLRHPSAMPATVNATLLSARC